jgi:fructose-bisphosphate aldolase class I
MWNDELIATANTLVAPGKGILAADESSGTIRKRFDSISVESTEENRIAYRGMLFTTEGAPENISGTILFDETIRQSIGGRKVPELLTARGIIPGIKVDKGTKPLAGAADAETITDGLDGLPDRCDEYRELGARFTKWRAVIRIGDGIPTDRAIRANAHALARYAMISQRSGLVPIVEPEVLMDGAHTIDDCEAATTRTLVAVFHELHLQGVLLEGMLLKPNMVLSGKDAPDQADPEQVAEATLRTFRRTVPAAVPGVVFLSGGQSDIEATVNLNAMNTMGPAPWQLSYSYGRALQAPALAAWAGSAKNVAAAQQAFLRRCRANGAARSGTYTPEMETTPVA